MKAFYKRPAGTTARLFQDLADYHDMQDKWGVTMGLFFDVVGVMSIRSLPIPSEWGYRESPFGPQVDECNEEPLQALTDPELARLGAFCYRLATALDRAGLSY